MKQTVTLIENDPFVARRISDDLRGRGYEVRLARDAAELALQLRAIGQPDLMLIARDLPFIDGVRLTRALKAAPRLRHIPVVLMGDSLSIDDLEMAMACGCMGVVDASLRQPMMPLAAAA
jgi:CheY-like chemotaxis protein